jgi:hypothetical protein
VIAKHPTIKELVLGSTTTLVVDGLSSSVSRRGGAPPRFVSGDGARRGVRHLAGRTALRTEADKEAFIGALKLTSVRIRHEQKHDATATLFRVKAQSFDLFTQIVLHEVGHAVDSMLGERTPPVYDFAGWREFSEADFDKWAGEMGGWDAIEARDKKAIQLAWADAARANTGVDKLVDETHPARAARYAKTGIVATARAGKKFDHTERVEHNGRVFVVRAPNLLYSLDANAAHSAPSVYSLYAPPEYFAESYVEYYRAVDGKPGSAARKGGSLPTTVKTWFDKNVDTLRYDPTRFLYGTSDDGTIKTDTEPEAGQPARAQH